MDEVIKEPETLSLAETLEQSIPDDAVCISVKVNAPDYDGYTLPVYGSVTRYLKDCGVEIIATSSGLHNKGKREIPHLHYHFIVNHYNEPSNPSQHRKRWLAKAGNEMESFGDATFKYQRLDITQARFQFLAYPLKEGNVLRRKCYTFQGELMTTEMIEYLKSVGETIYNTQLALRLRQEKCAERKQLALRELYDICKSESFTSFKQMMTWLDANYIDNLELEDMPDPKNYKTNCQKIAVKLKLLKYSEL